MKHLSPHHNPILSHLPTPPANMPIVHADAKVGACEAILEYTFGSEILLLEALNTAGQGNPLFYRGEFHDTIPRNKVLAEYGDNVADFVVMGEWMGHISTKRDRFVNSA